jgi:hypothetical protein
MMTESSSAVSPRASPKRGQGGETAALIIDNNHNNNSNDDNNMNGSNSNNKNTTNTMNNWFDKLTSPVQFCVLASGVFLFFGIHNYLQEAIMSVPGFKFGVMLGYLEVLGVTVCSYIERRCIAKETKRVAPISAYPLLTFCLMSSSSLSNLALNYINFPTKVYVASRRIQHYFNNKPNISCVFGVIGNVLIFQL